MQELIIDALRAKLEALPFVGLFGGLAQTLKTVDTEKNAKRMPIAADGRPLTPDGKQAGVMYFEHVKLESKGFDRAALAGESVLRLVYHGKLGDAPDAVAAAQVAVIKCIPEAMYNHRPLFKMTHTVTRILLHQDGIFEKYTYSEQTNQYLMKPYTAFAVEIKTVFNIPLSCVPQPPAGDM